MFALNDQQSHTLWQEETLDELEVPAIMPRCQYGDLWALGEHRLLCGDATNAGDVTRLLDGYIAQLGLHDPPYGLRARMSWGFGDGALTAKHDKQHAWKRAIFAPVLHDEKLFDPAHLLSSGETIVIWGANHFADKLPPSPAWIVWDKRVNLPSNDQSDGEVAWVSIGNRLQIIHHKWMGYVRDSEVGDKHIHPTQKPIRLFSEIIRRYTSEDDLVTDWYAGSGTTLLACEFTKRRAAVMEIEPHYCDVILSRWEQATGKHAVKISSKEQA